MVVWHDICTGKPLEAPRHVYWDAFADTKGTDADPKHVAALARQLAAVGKPADDEVLPYLRALHYVSRDKSACEHLDSESFFQSLFPYASAVNLARRDQVAYEAFCTLSNMLIHFQSHVQLFSRTYLDSLFDQLDSSDFEPSEEEYADEQGPYSLLCLCLVYCTIGCLLYTSPSPRDVEESRMPSSA